MAIILQNQGLHSDIRKRDLEEKYELIVEANDKVLERVVSLYIKCFVDTHFVSIYKIGNQREAMVLEQRLMPFS